MAKSPFFKITEPKIQDAVNLVSLCSAIITAVLIIVLGNIFFKYTVDCNSSILQEADIGQSYASISRIDSFN